MFDLAKQKEMIVTYKNKEFVFKQKANGICAYKYESNDKLNNLVETNNVNIVQKVTGNAQGYTKQDLEKAKRVTEMQEYFYWLGTKALRRYITGNQIINCDLLEEDVMNRDEVFRKLRVMYMD